MSGSTTVQGAAGGKLVLLMDVLMAKDSDLCNLGYDMP